MKVTLNWLRQYVDFDWSPEELAERLTMIGIEVEGVVKTGGELEGVVVARVVTRDRHPNADKLSICRVDDGKGERQVVCGAQNFQAGDKVPLVLPGATLPARAGEAPLTIKVGKIRGVESHGMLCSPQELGLPNEVDGLLILPADAPVGTPFAQYLGKSGSDVVYDLEITPNRPDLNSLIGIAREISAITGGELRVPSVELEESQSAVSELVAVTLQDPELCPRYTARVIKGVKIGASPDWLRSSLEKVGVRSISNVVDVTNYVMLETGQPLHAFDYHLLARGASGVPTIVVRRAAEGEKFTTLDAQERVPGSQTLLIADEQRAIALAGVMGGLNTEINDGTCDVLLESACFKPQTIRATSKKLGLRTDASYRFERGSDIGACDYASKRAAQLILQTAGGSLCAGVVDAYPGKVELKQITLRHEKVNGLLGLSLTAAQIEESLSRLGLKPASRKPQPVGDESAPATLTVKVPTYRVDLKREVDLIEEVVRLYGIDKIPSTPPRGAIGANPNDRVHDELSEARRILAGLGLCEAQGQTLIADAAARLVAGERFVPLENPLSSDMNVLRPSLMPGLLDSMRHNLSHKLYDVALFEVGRVFAPGANSSINEERRAAIALTGQRHPLFWSGEDREARYDIYDLKGLLDEFFEQFSARGISFQRREQGTSLFLESATIHLGKFVLGEVGQVLPALARQYDLRDPVFLAEFSIDVLLARRNPAKSSKVLPAYPAIRRDVALVLPEAVTHEAVAQLIKQSRPANLESVELFDVFRGKNLPAGRKSMAYAITYRHVERTLVDAEVNAAHEKLVQELTRKLDATVRE